MVPSTVPDSSAGVEAALRSQRMAWRAMIAKARELQRGVLPSKPPERILLFGVGSSHHAARLAAHVLLAVRHVVRGEARAIANHSLAVGRDLRPRQNDWVFGFSHRGKTPATLTALERCADAGAYPILVAGEGASSEDRGWLTIPTVPLETVEPHTVSLTSAVCVVTCLLGGIAVEEGWSRASASGDPEMASLREEVGAPPTVVVGEWEGEWVAREAALKLMEMAGLPVRSYSSEEYHHGPRAALGHSDRLWWVSRPEDPRAADMRGAYTLPASSEDRPLGWLEALVLAQWSALAIAQQSRPGSGS